MILDAHVHLVPAQQKAASQGGGNGLPGLVLGVGRFREGTVGMGNVGKGI